MTWLDRFRVAALALLFPQSCVLCGRWTVEPDGRPLCRFCRAGLREHWLPLCPCCGIPVPGELSGQGYPCSRCRSEPCGFDKAASWGPYAGALRAILLEYKFRGGRRLAGPLTELLAETYHREFADDGVTGLVPVPTHGRRARERGFDHTLELARGLAQRIDLPVKRVAERIRNTPPQHGLDSAARRRNLKGALRLKGDVHLDDERFLVVDDILTTGTTARELTALLREGGCRWTGVLTVARVSVHIE